MAASGETNWQSPSILQSESVHTQSPAANVLVTPPKPAPRRFSSESKSNSSASVFESSNHIPSSVFTVPAIPEDEAQDVPLSPRTAAADHPILSDGPPKPPRPASIKRVSSAKRSDGSRASISYPDDTNVTDSLSTSFKNVVVANRALTSSPGQQETASTSPPKTLLPPPPATGIIKKGSLKPLLDDVTPTEAKEEFRPRLPPVLSGPAFVKPPPQLPVLPDEQNYRDMRIRSIRRRSGKSSQDPVLLGSNQKQSAALDALIWKPKRGWLAKKGGKEGSKAARSRFFVLENGTLMYFKNESDSRAVNKIDVKDMQSVDKSFDPKVEFSFTLTTDQRIYYFHAPDATDFTDWMIRLGAVIQNKNRFIEKTDEAKQGFLHVRPSDTKEWTACFVSVESGNIAMYLSEQDFLKQLPPWRELQGCLVNIKKGQNPALFQFLLTTIRVSYEVRAPDELIMDEWLRVIEKAVWFSLEQVQPDNRQRRNTVETIPCDEVLPAMLSYPQTAFCSDCGCPGAEWASISLGVVICIQCSGAHRNLGTDFSKVRSLKIDSCWTSTLVSMIKAMSGATSNEFWEADLGSFEKITPETSQDERQEFIRNKYERRLFCQLTPVEDKEKALVDCVEGDSLMDSLELIVTGCRRDYIDPETGHSIIGLAKIAEQPLQVELLKQNGFKYLDSEKSLG